MKKLHLYFRTPHPKDRFVPGDRYIIPLLRKLIKGQKVGGIQKVFINLCKGFNQIGIDYDINLPFEKIPHGEPVIVLGNGKYALEGYHQPNPIIAGIGLMTHPAEWPGFFNEYPVAVYLQHSDWTRKMYARFYDPAKCVLWPAGIDTEKWSPVANDDKKFDLLVYSKVMWNKEQTERNLKLPLIKKIEELGLTYRQITYGEYKETTYLNMLKECRAMIFLCEHESQGFACCEAMSMDIPVFAWDQGFWLDPHLAEWGDKDPIHATSIPFFNDLCGMSFRDYTGFEREIGIFWDKVREGEFTPREYVLENLTLKKSAQRMLDIVSSVYK